MRRAAIASDLIELTVSDGVAVTIDHGLGRQIGGWIVVYQSVAVDLVVADPAADTRRSLTLLPSVPSGTTTVRLVLL